MASVLDCCNPCGTIQPTQVPGLEGPPGLDGTSGINAFSTTTANFVVPAISGNVVVTLDSSVWMVIGQVVIAGAGYANPAAGGPAHFTVTSIPTATTVELQFLGSVGDVLSGETILAGATVSPSAA